MDVQSLKTDIETAFRMPGVLVVTGESGYAIERTFLGTYNLWRTIEGRRARHIAELPVVVNGYGGPSQSNIADVAQKFVTAIRGEQP